MSEPIIETVNDAIREFCRNMPVARMPNRLLLGRSEYVEFLTALRNEPITGHYDPDTGTADVEYRGCKVIKVACDNFLDVSWSPVRLR